MAINDITPLWTTSMQSYGQCGLPTLDMDGRRIWAIWTGGGRTAPTIEYSDDYGGTWTVWAEIPSASSAPLMDKDTLIIDGQGNCYYNCRTGASPYVRGIGRVDAVTKSVTKCFDFYVSSGLAAPTLWDAHAYPWSWTVDNSGAIYIGQYALSYWNGSSFVGGGNTGFNAQYIWKSSDSGSSWTRLDYFVTNFPNARHIHSIHSNPYDDVLWVNIGDVSKETFYSTDGGSTFSQVTSTATYRGFTGLTFTSAHTYFGDDLEAPTKIWRTPAGGKTPLAISFTPDAKRLAPMYYLRSCGENEMWFTTVNDNMIVGARSSLVKLSKSAGSPDGWTQTVLLEAPTYSYAESTMPYAITHNGRGVMPESHPFIYFNQQSWGGTQGQEVGVYRVERAEIPTNTLPDFDFDVLMLADPPPAYDFDVLLMADPVELPEYDFDVVLTLDRIGSPRRRLAVIDPFTPTRL